MPHPFLTAHWSNVALISYTVPPAALAKYLPAGGAGPDGVPIEPDTRPEFVKGGEKQALATLVALEFRRTRVLGVRWPGFRSFCQINLRFYVRHGRRRGVVFVRQVVPKPFIAWTARRFYDEPYVSAPIESHLKQQHRTIGVEYRMQWPEGGLSAGGSAFGKAVQGKRMDTHIIRVYGTKPVVRPGADTLEHWIKEHQWAFGQDRKGRPTVFEIIHPVWGVYPVIEWQVNLAFAQVFGTDWGFLDGSQPVSQIFAVGSDVAVFPRQRTIGVRWSERRTGKG